MARNSLYNIIATRRYCQDLKHIQSMERYDIRLLDSVINTIASGNALHEKFHNHKLHGTYEGCEECHIQSDWLLIYRKYEDKLILQLMRTGRHTDLFGE